MVELLAPAGSLKKLKLAVYYGADAVYFGGKEFSLRSFAENFTDGEIAEGIAFAHAHGRRAYAALNIFARNEDFPRLEERLRLLSKLGADGVILSDLGVLSLCRRVAPSLKIHVSTQANTMNADAAKMWRDLGATRVVLARELSVEEIAAIHRACPDLSLEVFVHGAMCISYSGRCYLSDYMDGRPANRGACVQACRRAYRIQTDEGGTGEFYDVEEDGRGTYVLNSKDLNLSARLKELEIAGVSSFKIEGRMKGEYYLATVVNAYRRILDGGYTDELGQELLSSPHRAYTEGFAFGGDAVMQSYESSQTGGMYDFIAVAKGMAGRNGEVIADADMVGGKSENPDMVACVEMRGRFFEGDILEILSPFDTFKRTFEVKSLYHDGEPVSDAKLVQGIYTFRCPYVLREGDILRRKKL